MSFARNRSYSTRKQRIVLGLLPCLIPTILVLVISSYYSISNITADSFGGQTAFLSAIGFSLRVATISTAVSLIFGMLLAIWLWRQSLHFPTQLYTLPLILPHIVAAYFVVVFFSQSGLLASLLHNVGLIQEGSDFPVLVFDNDGIGIILAYIYKEAPFVCLLVLASLRKIPHQLVQTADIFHSTSWRTYRAIILPQISTSLWISGIIIFMYSFASFDIPFLIGSSSEPMLAIEAYRLFFEASLSRRPEAQLLFFGIWVVSLIFLCAFIVMRSLLSRRHEESLWL